MAKQVLILDDNSDNLELLSFYFASLQSGYEIHQATAGSEVAGLLEKTHFDLALQTLFSSTWKCRNSTATRSWNCWRADEKFQGIPIVAYTTHTSHLNTAHNAGFDGFLGKPLNRHEFADNLARILRGEPVWEIP